MKITKHVQDDLDYRKTLFRVKCMIQGKCCSLIIDGGSSKTLASNEVFTS